MKAKQKHLILSLIKDDLIHCKLVYALNNMGLQADGYLLDLGGSIFKLMGFEDSPEDERIYEYYLALTQRARYIDVLKMRERIDELALEIFTELLVLKPFRRFNDARNSVNKRNRIA